MSPADFAILSEERQWEELSNADQCLGFFVKLDETPASFEVVNEQEAFLNALRTLAKRDPARTALSLIPSGCLERLANLAVGPSDVVTWRALQILLYLAGPFAPKGHPLSSIPHPVSDETALELSEKMREQPCDIDRWVVPFAGRTPATSFLPLSCEEISALSNATSSVMTAYPRVRTGSPETVPSVVGWFRHHAVTALLSPNNLAVMAALEHRISNCMRQMAEQRGDAAGSDGRATGYFVRLSTRSPKDSVLLPARVSALRAAAGSDDAATRERCARESLMVRSGVEALDLLCTSHRVSEDLGTVKELTDVADCPISIVVRAWEPVPMWGELRGFMCRRKLTALSQYFDERPFPALLRYQDAIAARVQQFFEDEIVPRLDAIGLESAIVDVAFARMDGSEPEVGDDVNLDDYRVVLMEFNPFGQLSGAAMFYWEDESDCRLLFEGPFTFRICHEENKSSSDGD